eukprot:CAMPEP_0174894582 /NCGR_PEP_ID=MMETSP0167-20121228/9197_1 /TAXON_ID=38298 /ORGANISM="Rhodella maculata, Strain CCMP736" /LENGTH=177 /DNA_ID=CAMNT_0016133709 /DNA_START=371 /DNA_END=904 /DNA_ORIENTATION=+
MLCHRFGPGQPTSNAAFIWLSNVAHASSRNMPPRNRNRMIRRDNFTSALFSFATVLLFLPLLLSLLPKTMGTGGSKPLDDRLAAVAALYEADDDATDFSARIDEFVKMYDKKEDGMLDKEEAGKAFEECMTLVGRDANKEMFERFWEVADENKSGKLEEREIASLFKGLSRVKPVKK